MQRSDLFQACLMTRAVVFCLCIGLSAEAQQVVRYDPSAAVNAHQWDVVDISIQASALPEHPIDVSLSAVFEHESGDRISVPGFYNGRQDFVIRFTPSRAGMWTYRTESTWESLDKLAGKLSAANPRPGRRGGIEVDPEQPTKFQFENGEHYFPIAFESDWLFALDAENPQDIPRTRKLVDTLASSGFNQVVLNVYAYDVNWEKDEQLDLKYEYGRPRVFPFEGTNEEPKHEELNIDFYQRFDRVIDYLDQQGIVAHLMIYVWNKQVNWPEADSAADNRYFDYVVKRYQAFPNLIWDVSKEALGYGHNDVNYITGRIRRLRELDSFNRLVTVHAYNYCKKFPDQVDFVSVQLWLSELYSVMRNVCQAIPGKPILNIEHGGYERGPYVVFTGNYTSPEVCLERAWQCIFAGTYPTHYWQGAAWNVVIPDIDELALEDRPRLDYYAHMRAFVDRYRPDQLIAGDKKANAGFCLHNDRDRFIYYVPKECNFIGVRPSNSIGAKMMTGTWYNPFDGTYSQPEEKQLTQWPAFEVPDGDGFRILIVELQPADAASQ